MDNGEKQIYRFADVEVDARRGYLRRGGEERQLRPKPFQVLVYLIEHREGNISKDKLINDIWRDTAVVDDVLVQSVKDIRRALGDDTHRPRFIKTIPKFGYRFIGEIEEEKSDAETQRWADTEKNGETWNLKLEIDRDSRPQTADRKPPSLFKSRAVLIALSGSIIALSLFILLSKTFRQETGEITLATSSGKKPVFVMFFENQSNDGELGWLREGLADMLIADLSRSPNLTVLSRGQLHVLLDRAKLDAAETIRLDDTLEIARRAAAEALVTGSYARLGDKVRLEVQLYDVQTGELIAAESLTLERAEMILTEIDLLSLKLANRLGARENNLKAGLAETMTDNLEAYRYYSLALEKSQALHNKEAVALLEKAIALDPEFAMAHARIGYAYAVAWNQTERGKPHLERAFALSGRLKEKDRLDIAAWYTLAHLDFERAIEQFREIVEKYPLDSEARWRLARLLVGEERRDEALSVLRQGLALDPDDKNLQNQSGLLLAAMGRHDEAIAAHRRYVALAPDEANAYDSLASTYQWSGDYRAAIENYIRALELDPNFDIAIVHLGDTRAWLGQYREALKLYRRYLAAAPSDTERLYGYRAIFNVQMKMRDFAAAEQTAAEINSIDREHVWEAIVLAHARGNKTRANELAARLLPADRYANRGARLSNRFEFYYRGTNALRNNHADEAIAHFRESLRRLPPIWYFDPFEDCLGNAYLELGRFDEAIAEYERILRLNPNYPLAHFHLAQAYQGKGMPPETVVDSYRRFLEIWKDADPDLPEVVSAKNFLAGHQ